MGSTTNGNENKANTTEQWAERALSGKVWNFTDIIGASVAAFHQKIGAPEPQLLEEENANENDEGFITEELDKAASYIETLSAVFGTLNKDFACDKRVLRAKLILEECGELMIALSQRDEVALADACYDLQYVVIGTLVTFDLPCATGLHEVHCSNMTKHTAKGACANHTDDKGKGPDYIAPDIVRVIKEWRES